MKGTSLATHSRPPVKLNTRSTILLHRPQQSKSSPVLQFSELKSSPCFPSQCKLKPIRCGFTVRTSNLSPVDSDARKGSKNLESEAEFYFEEVRSPVVPLDLPLPGLSLSDRAFFLLSFIAFTTSAAMVGFVAAAVPAIFAMRRVAIALTKLADALRKEIPGTMAAVRLTGIEISDLILELSELSHEISDGVSKSAQAVQAADAGIRQIGSLARDQTMSMIEERANLPEISLQPVVAGAAKKTSHVVGKATRTFLNIISRREITSENEDGATQDRLQV